MSAVRFESRYPQAGSRFRAIDSAASIVFVVLFAVTVIVQGHRQAL